MCGNLEFLGQFWTEIGTVTNHQSISVNYDWNPERISVGNVWYLFQLVLYVIGVLPEVYAGLF